MRRQQEIGKNMAFKLSGRSLGKLEGVHPKLVDTVKEAIKVSLVDFGVIYGVRSLAEQKRLYEAGRSQTMKSKHLVQDDGYSHAVDLMAYDGSEPSWDIVMYDDIADAMKAAAKETGAKVRWGAAWNIDNIAEWERPMEDAMNNYIDIRRSQGRRPFIDGPHFELMEA
jgi:peptidoglycan L-alanyl-D-glutamate endopeptidase CwlK